MAWASRWTSSMRARRAMSAAYDASGVQPRALEDLVDRVLRAVHGHPDEVEVSTRHGTDGVAVGGVVPGAEHVRGVHRDRQLAAQGSLPRSDEVLLGPLEDEHGDPEQGE